MPWRLLIGLFALQLAIDGLLLTYWQQEIVQHRQTAQAYSRVLAHAVAPYLATPGYRANLTDYLRMIGSDAAFIAVFDESDPPQLVAQIGKLPPRVSVQLRPDAVDSHQIDMAPVRFGSRDVGQLWVLSTPPSAWLLGLGLMVTTLLPWLMLLFWFKRTQKQFRQLEQQLAADRELMSDFVLPTTTPWLAPLRRGLEKCLEHTRQRAQDWANRHEILAQEARRFNAMLHGISAVAWEADSENGQFVFVSSEAPNLLGYSVEHWCSRAFFDETIHPDDRNWVANLLTHRGAERESYSVDFRALHRSGHWLWLRLIGSVEKRDGTAILAGIIFDISKERQSQQQLVDLKNKDPMTDLINRRYFQELFAAQITHNQLTGVSGALLFLDVDQFKFVNDTFGHHAGDEYLKQLATLLRQTLPEDSVLSRIGGDEFGMLLPMADLARANGVGQQILMAMRQQEFAWDNRRTPFSASIGIALFPEHGGQVSELMARADAAVYLAKEEGRNTYRVFRGDADSEKMQEKLYWEERIRNALKFDQFLLYFQPIVQLADGEIHHYETLLRMQDKEDKVIAPGRFIAIAERFGLIRDIDRWVVANAIRAQGYSQQIGRPVSLTINLSGRHFGGRESDSEILDIIRQSTLKYHADPHHIIFEVTETAAVENFAAACEFIRGLRQAGYRFALDDFGAGYSSFDYLRNIQVDYVKIDGSFVRNLHNSEVDRVFISAITNMASNLKLKTIAEFVENQQIVEVLKQLKVDYGQGYHFAKPAPNFLPSRFVKMG